MIYQHTPYTHFSCWFQLRIFCGMVAATFYCTTSFGCNIDLCHILERCKWFIKCKCSALFIAIYSAIISSIFAILLRDHCFPRTAPPHMLIKVQQRGETLYTQLSVDIRHLCQWRFDRWDRIGADRNWRDDCSMSIGYCCVISNYYYYISMPYTSHVVYVHCRENSWRWGHSMKGKIKCDMLYMFKLHNILF